MPPFVPSKSMTPALNCRALAALTQLWVCMIVLWMNVHASAIEATPSFNADSIDLQLRVVWGASTANSYQGVIEIDQGVMECTQQLGIDEMDAGFLVSDSPVRISIEDYQTRFGGFDLNVRAPSHARISITMYAYSGDVRNEPPQQFQWLLSELVDQQQVHSLKVGDAKLSVARVPGDRLRLITSRPHLIYDSHESLEMQIQPHATPWTETSGILEYTIVRIDDQREILRRTLPVVLDEKGSAEPLKLNQLAPEQEGVYELRIKLEPRRILPGLPFRSSSITRCIEFVVCNQVVRNMPEIRDSVSESPSRNSSSLWEGTLTIGVGEAEIVSQVDDLLQRVDTHKRFSFLRDAVRSFSFGRNSTAPSTNNNDASLRIETGKLARVTLPKLDMNVLHRLTVVVDSTQTSFQASLLNAATAGGRSPSATSLASGIYQEHTSRSLQSLITPSLPTSAATLELLFWPAAGTTYLEIANLSGTDSLSLRQIHVDRIAQKGKSEAETRDERRKPTAVMELPFASIRGIFSQPQPNSYDDWQQYLTFAERIAQMAQCQGFDCIAMQVDGQGGTLFPSSHLSSNCRLDTGTFSVDGRDPIRKDIVELMYRCCSKRGILFVPMLELSGRVRELESIESQSDTERLLASHPRSRGVHDTQIYNPFSRRVQRAVAMCIDEFRARYESNPHYRGFAIQLSNQSPLRLVANLVETHASIRERFHRETGHPPLSGDAARDHLLASQKQSLFMQWCHRSLMGSIEEWRIKPEWVSMDQNLASDGNSIPQVVPIVVDETQVDWELAKSRLISSWCMQSPGPIWISCRQLKPRYDSELAQLLEISRPYREYPSIPVPHPYAAQSMSRTRVWRNPIHETSVLIANSNAVAETIEIEMNAAPQPMEMRCVGTNSTLAGQRGPWMQLIPESNTCRLTIPSCEVVELAWDQVNQSRSEQSHHHSALAWRSFDAITIKYLEAGLRIVEDSINALSVPVSRSDPIRNSGFESSNSPVHRGGLEGWSTSLDPNATVSVSKKQAAEGESSIQFEVTEPTAIAWLQSDPFPVIAAEHLSISFYAASSHVPESVVVSLWRLDVNKDRFEKIDSQEVSGLLRNKSGSKWQAIRVDMNELVPLASKAFHASQSYSHLCRLQWEVKGKGVLWLDSISSATEYLAEEERRGLRSELFLAKTSIQSGDFGPSIYLLERIPGQVIGAGQFQKAQSALPSTQSLEQETMHTPPSVDRTSAERIDPKSQKRWKSIWWPGRK
jgi:hypothetical protein